MHTLVFHIYLLCNYNVLIMGPEIKIMKGVVQTSHRGSYLVEDKVN